MGCRRGGLLLSVGPPYAQHMSREQRGRKHRTPQKRTAPWPAPVPRPRSSNPVFGGVPLLRGAGGSDSANSALTATLLEQATPEQLVDLLLPHLWASISQTQGVPANICVDASTTLRHAYGQLGVRSEFQVVELVVEDENGDRVRHATLEPTWKDDGTVFNGHCVLILPDSQRIVDATVEQFDKVGPLGMGPLIGKVVFSTVASEPGELPVPGTRFVLQRGPLVLTYTLAGDRANEVMLQQPYVAAHADRYRRTGINVASLMLVALRIPDVIGRAMQTPYPRLRALLRAVGDAPYDVDAAGDVRFVVPNGDGDPHLLRLDEIALPPSAPGAHPRT